MRLKDLEKVKVIAGFPGIGKSDFVKTSQIEKVDQPDYTPSPKAGPACV